MCRLIASNIITAPCLQSRIERIGKRSKDEGSWSIIFSIFSREVGCCGWYLSLSPQLQWSLSSLCSVQQCSCLQTEENLGQSQQNGESLLFFHFEAGIIFIVDQKHAWKATNACTFWRPKQKSKGRTSQVKNFSLKNIFYQKFKIEGAILLAFHILVFTCQILHSLTRGLQTSQRRVCWTLPRWEWYNIT